MASFFADEKKRARIAQLTDDISNCKGNIFKFKAKMRALDKAVLNESLDSIDGSERRQARQRFEPMDRLTHSMVKRQLPEAKQIYDENDVYKDFVKSTGFLNFPKNIQSSVSYGKEDFHANTKNMRENDRYLDEFGISKESFLGKNLSFKSSQYG